MTPLWIGIAAVVLLLAFAWRARARSHARLADHGTVSTSWLAEQKMAPKDHLSS